LIKSNLDRNKNLLVIISVNVLVLAQYNSVKIISLHSKNIENCLKMIPILYDKLHPIFYDFRKSARRTQFANKTNKFDFRKTFSISWFKSIKRQLQMLSYTIRVV